jgi:uncharacterized membrane protein
MWSFLLLPPLVLDLVLCVLFSKGLLQGRKALLTTLAMQARGGHELDAKTVRYTRLATAVWASVSGSLALVILSGLLIDGMHPIAVTAAFTQGPCYLVLLVAEFLVRRYHLDHLEHMNFVDFIRFLRRVDYVAVLRD